MSRLFFLLASFLCTSIYITYLIPVSAQYCASSHSSCSTCAGDDLCQWCSSTGCQALNAACSGTRYIFQSDCGSRSSSTGAIAGAIIRSICLCCCIVALLWFWRRRRWNLYRNYHHHTPHASAPLAIYRATHPQPAVATVVVIDASQPAPQQQFTPVYAQPQEQQQPQQYQPNYAEGAPPPVQYDEFGQRMTYNQPPPPYAPQ